MKRASFLLAAVLLAVAAAVIGMLWRMSAPLPASSVTGTAQVGGPFTLTDQNGHPRTDRDFRGRFLLIYFGYTRCPDVCPLTLNVMSDALGRLGAEASRIAPVFVSVDPARDTPAVLKTYVAAFGKNFTGLTGSAGQIAAIAREYHVYIEKEPLKGGGYAVNHSSVIYLMGPDGKFVTYYDESDGPGAIAADLRGRL